MKFAVLEMKLLVRLLKSYDIYSNAYSNEEKPVFVEGILRRVKGGVKCSFKKKLID